MWSKPHDAVGDEVRLLAVVRHVDRRRPLIAQERPHVDSEAVAQVPVQRAKGLIEEEEARAGGQGSCQGDALCLAAGERGDVTVLEAGAHWGIAASSSLDEEVFATPALDGGHLWVRTATQLYDFAAPRP